MIDKFDYRPGEYKVINRDGVWIRGTPTTAGGDNLVRNTNGNTQRLVLGQVVPVYRIQTTKDGWVWGIISNDTADRDHFICLWNLNTRFAELVKPFEDTSISFSQLVLEVSQLKERVARIEKIAGIGE